MPTTEERFAALEQSLRELETLVGDILANTLVEELQAQLDELASKQSKADEKAEKVHKETKELRKYYKHPAFAAEARALYHRITGK